MLIQVAEDQYIPASDINDVHLITVAPDQGIKKGSDYLDSVLTLKNYCLSVRVSTSHNIYCSKAFRLKDVRIHYYHPPDTWYYDSSRQKFTNGSMRIRYVEIRTGDIVWQSSHFDLIARGWLPSSKKKHNHRLAQIAEEVREYLVKILEEQQGNFAKRYMMDLVDQINKAQ